MNRQKVSTPTSQIERTASYKIGGVTAVIERRFDGVRTVSEALMKVIVADASDCGANLKKKAEITK